MLSVRCPHVMVRMRALAVARRTCAAIMLLVGMTMLVGCAASGTAEASGSNKSSANGLSVTLPLRSVSATKWAPATGSDAQYLGYLPQLFAAQLRAKHPNVPVGIIQISWGGTGIALHMKGGSIYANHVIPLTGYRVAGVLWHQGEDDTATCLRRCAMKSNFAVLINQYRAVFGEDDLPFLCVQLARYSSGNPIRAHRSAGAARRAGQCGSEHDGASGDDCFDRHGQRYVEGHPSAWQRHSRRAYGDTMVGDDRFKGIE